MTVAVLGGSVGSLLGMYTVRHKTKHPKFTIGIPLLLAGRIDAALNAEVVFADYQKAHPEANIKIAAYSDDVEQVAIPVARAPTRQRCWPLSIRHWQSWTLTEH